MASSLNKSENIMHNMHSEVIQQESSSCAIQSFSHESSLKSQNLVYKAKDLPSYKQSMETNERIQKAETSLIKEAKEMSIINGTNNLVKVYEQPNKEHGSNMDKINVQHKNTKKEDLLPTNEYDTRNEQSQFEHKRNDQIQQNSVEYWDIQTFSSSMDANKSMTEALTIAPDRPYSPLPSPQPSINIIQTDKQESTHTSQTMSEQKEDSDTKLGTPTYIQQPKRSITPAPTIKTYNPPENVEPPVPMPAETTPYIPPDFKITIEPKINRNITSSPMVEALTTAPERPYTPVNINSNPIERGSLKDALTIAPDRPYSPLPVNVANISTHTTSSSEVYMQTTSCEIVKPIATQTLSHQSSEQTRSEFSNMQNTYLLQSSSETSAFKPVTKQLFPLSQPHELCNTVNNNMTGMTYLQQTNTPIFSEAKQESVMSETISQQHSTFKTNSGFSSVKSAQSYFEQLDKKESLTSSAVRSTSGLQKPDSIPPYQKHIEKLPSQRGISPDTYKDRPILQRPVTPSTEPPRKSREKSREPMENLQICPPKQIPQLKTPTFQIPTQQISQQFHKDTPISMTFQPVTDDNFIRASPIRSRPSTPSMINKPAPIVPHYQMNLVTVEHLAPESHLYDPSSPEASRSPTPKPRSRSPAPGPPPNPLKAQAPRIKEHAAHLGPQQTLLAQATSNLRKEHETGQRDYMQMQKQDFAGHRMQTRDQPAVYREQAQYNMGYKSENYVKGDVDVKENTMTAQNFGQRQMQTQNTSEFGHTTVQTTRKTFEEYEHTQSAKTIEIRKGGSSSLSGQQYLEANSQSSKMNATQVYPNPVMSIPYQEHSSVNTSNYLNNDSYSTASLKTESYKPKPLNSGANQDPVCDPTPSTGPSVGAAARGKTFGVSSAPKRGRGVLNKAALPGSRVPLCASCNGNIRGPFITALGRIWCPEHFICVNATCRRPLQDIGFVEENGQLYCEFCFEQYIAPACDKCHAKIKGDCLNAIGKHYHPECFNCVYCGKLFGNNPFFLEDGLPYCEADWNELFTTKCFACGFPVEAGDRWVEALNNNYHSQCFNCTVCKKNLEGQSFFAKGGRPFCKTHAR